MSITLTFPTFKHAPGQDYPGDTTTSFEGHVARGSANPGVDFGCPIGTPVYAPARIRITEVWPRDTGSGGLYVRARCIDDQGNDSGFVILGLHLSEILCSLGDVLERGELFARSGNSGGVAPHLHFTIILDGTHVDPMLYLVDAAGLPSVTHQEGEEDMLEFMAEMPIQPPGRPEYPHPGAMTEDGSKHTFYVVPGKHLFWHVQNNGQLVFYRDGCGIRFIPDQGADIMLGFDLLGVGESV